MWTGVLAAWIAAGPLSAGWIVAGPLSAGWIVAGPLSAAADDVATREVTHVVQRGETLSSIAETYLGNPHLWPALYRANRDQIRDPGRLYPGQTLSIPDVPTTAIPEDARHLEPAPRLERAG